MDKIHPMAPEHLPPYLSPADGSDPLLILIIGGTIIAVLCLGALYFRIHSIPEHLGEKHNNTQINLISVLTILALFTHNNIFWVVALIIAVVKIPDFMTPLNSIAEALSQMAKKDETTKCSENPPISATQPKNHQEKD